jgi:hypothetical protein
MRLIKAFALGLALLLGSVVSLPARADNATVAAQARTNWANARAAYLNSVKSYQVVAAYATIITQYTTATDKAGATLDSYLNLKLASAPLEQVTPVVDQLSKDLLAMKAVRAKATGGLATALSSALSQQNLVTQTALGNMR